MTNKDAEDKYLSRIVELHELFDSIRELIYITVHNINSDVRLREARKKFSIALIKLGIVK